MDKLALEKLSYCDAEFLKVHFCFRFQYRSWKKFCKFESKQSRAKFDQFLWESWKKFNNYEQKLNFTDEITISFWFQQISFNYGRERYRRWLWKN